MNWKPHTKQPDYFPLACLIATPDGQGGYYLQDDIYNWDGSQFCQEISGHPIHLHAFWWIPESDVLQGLPA